MEFRNWFLAAVLCGASLSYGRTEGGREIFLHPFAPGSVQPTSDNNYEARRSTTVRSSRAFSLGETDTNNQVDQLISSLNLNARIGITKQWKQGFSLYRGDRIQTTQFGFNIDGYPFCQFELKVHESLDGQLAAFGGVPTVDVDRDFSDADWASDAEILSIVQDGAAMRGLIGAVNLEHKSRCLWVQDGQIFPAWDVEATAAGRLYKFTVDANQEFSFEPKHFHATGQAYIYDSNENDGVKTAFELRDMSANGTLQNPYFIGCLPKNSLSSSCPVYEGSTKVTYQPVNEPTGVFNYDPNTDPSRFAQTSVFTNANRALSWLQGIGYNNYGEIPIRLAVHAAFDGDTNNALYEPRTDYAMIYIGDGDGGILQNLATDADVVSHELGHHVVYSSIKRIEGESLVLHEGLADFFTFARSGNACLGESICTESVTSMRLCAVPKTCLRTAENSYTLTGSDLPREAHQKSQLISGFLWDLTKKDQIPTAAVAQLVLKSIDLMISNSGYKHFIVSMLLADNSKFSGQYCQVIKNRAEARGFGIYLADVTCEKVQKEGSGGKVDAFLGSAVPAPSSTKETRKGKTNCGVLGGASGGSGQSRAAELALILLPVFVLSSRLFRK